MDDVVTAVFPGDCRHCEGPLVRASDVPVCLACFARLTPSTLPGCTRCGDGVELAFDLEDLRFSGMLPAGIVCRQCRAVPPDFERAVSFGVYAHELRTLIHLLKFDGMRKLAETLGPHLGRAICELEAVAARELQVVAVPLFAARERQRGFNQSVLLADAACAFLKRERPQWTLQTRHGVLVRKRSTATQFELSTRGRRQNLRGAFMVTGDVTDREFLLIDDILTSGATARECARVLRAAGAAQVWVATLARAQKESVRRAHEDPGEMVARWDLTATH